MSATALLSPPFLLEFDVKYAGIGPIAVHLPERIETNEDLQEENPGWNMELIGSKTGIQQRHIAAPDECSSDLGVRAAEKLFAEHNIDPTTIDFILFCSQTPDYALPTTSCLIQQRLGLRTDVGALDFNLGCSGYVYGLSIADGIIRSGTAKRILFIAAETYTKLIHPSDRSLRTIFGDGGTATLIEPCDQPSMWGFKYGTDGTGADTLLASETGFRNPEQEIQPRHRRRWPSQLYMDGPSLINFTVSKIPPLVDLILAEADIPKEQVGYYLFHQATFKMLEQLQLAMQVEPEKLPIRLENIGNTVSCTLPILIDHLRKSKELQPEMTNLLVGFGVGLSWAGCVWQDHLGNG